MRPRKYPYLGQKKKPDKQALDPKDFTSQIDCSTISSKNLAMQVEFEGSAIRFQKQ